MLPRLCWCEIYIVGVKFSLARIGIGVALKWKPLFSHERVEMDGRGRFFNQASYILFRLAVWKCPGS
jgi:hypothetical protein